MAGTSPAMTKWTTPHPSGARRLKSNGLFSIVMAGFVYITTNRRNGILYTGVTSDLVRRIHEHREGLIDGFTKRYSLKRLVYFEDHDDIRSAIQREKTIKHWPRAWKVRLIHGQNPDWQDLFEGLA